jgi:hypothetical protein
MADAELGEKLRVFISYLRKDEAFAQELLTGLELTGFQPSMGKHDIAAGEDCLGLVTFSKRRTRSFLLSRLTPSSRSAVSG